MNNINLKEHLYSALQGFGLGGIVMAYITNYNRSQLPIALLCLIFSIVCRFGSKK